MAGFYSENSNNLTKLNFIWNKLLPVLHLSKNGKKISEPKVCTCPKMTQRKERKNNTNMPSMRRNRIHMLGYKSSICIDWCVGISRGQGVSRVEQLGLPTCNIVSAKYVIMRCVLRMRKGARLCDEEDFKWLNLHQLKWCQFKGTKCTVSRAIIMPTWNIVSTKYVIMRCILPMRKGARSCDEVDFTTCG